MTIQVKGAAVLSRLAFVREEFGEEGWNRVLEALQQEDREVMRGRLLSASWYPFELNRRLDEAIVERLGGGDAKIFERLGARSATENLTGPHAAFLSPGDPQRFLALTGQIYRFYYDVGERTYEATGPTSGVITTRGAETFSETDCMTVIGWYVQALEMCGAKDVAMVEETCRARGGEHCRYRLSWS